MANNNIGGVISSFQKYIFHFLPGLPVLAGLCIILWHLGFNLAVMSKVIHKLQLSSRDLPGFTFFLILLTLVLLTVLLLGMVVDAVRHAFEYAFLIPKWKEYWVARRIKEPLNTPKDLMLKLDIFIKFHETEYFYIEFFGNVALSLAFLWGVILWYYPCYFGLDPLRFFKWWMHFVFILRGILAPAFWRLQKVAECVHNKIGEIKNCHRERKCSNHKVRAFFCSIIQSLVNAILSLVDDLSNLFFRIFDFSATILSLGLLYCCSSELRGNSIIAFHFFAIGIFIIMASFEVYIVRFRRYGEVLEEGLFFQAKEKDGSATYLCRS